MNHPSGRPRSTRGEAGYGSSRPPPSDRGPKSAVTLRVFDLPAEHCAVVGLVTFFSRFGDIQNIQVHPDKNKVCAFIMRCFCFPFVCVVLTEACEGILQFYQATFI